MPHTHIYMDTVSEYSWIVGQLRNPFLFLYFWASGYFFLFCSFTLIRNNKSEQSKYGQVSQESIHQHFHTIERMTTVAALN